MNSIPRGQPLVLGSWLALMVLATVRQALSPTGGLPSPSTYLGGSGVMTFFYVGAVFAPDLFGVLAVGVVVAALLKPYLTPAGTQAAPGPLDQIATYLDNISGASKPA